MSIRFAGLRQALVHSTAIIALMASSASVRAAGELVVGATVPLTGPLSLTGKQYSNSLQMAVDEINAAGGVKGKKIALAVEDAQASNGTAINALVKVVQEKNPPFIFLTSYSTQNIAVAPEVAKAKRPAMYAGGADAVSRLRNPWMFRIRPQDSTAAVAMARFVKDTLKGSKPGVIYIQNDFGQGGANAAVEFLAKQGIKVVASESYGQNNKDMSAQLLNLKNKGADVIVAFVYPQDGALLLRQIKMLGLKQPVVASSAAFVPAALQLLSANDLGNVWGVIDAYLPGTPQGKAFLDRYRKRFGVDADPYAAAYYDGAMLMAKAMNEVGTDAEPLRAYLAKVKDYQGVSHRYRFDAEGNGVHDVAVVKFKSGSKDMEFVDSINVE
ncbi:ABC transporter substrate-binding protein [Chitinasiproducens palmae]|uniref:Amino acid/amide ABC transporter substrate-binding protein, HAAT family n=1 Tax=Chitinasiproducens palmae TaxID=1770053 RepID=A0A1H2PSD9_9BURK|nr:ABC transporter substrate-binding protein [Chitinasiproducens palmae]SDV49494.1 amino acid/amide ABC transporter substrate-binding protein, HAAT family [Chitinasiproducens palmae]